VLIFRRTNCISVTYGVATLFRCLFSTQIARGLSSSRNLCTEQTPKESNDTICYTNTICPPEDEHNSARDMYRNVIDVLK